MKRIIIWLSLSLVSTMSVADHKALVQSALESIADDIDESWAFTETTTEDDVQFVGRFDPSLTYDQRWKLLSVDGRNPTAEELAEYSEDKNDDFDREDDEEEKDDDGMSIDLISMDTLELLEETESYWIFRFVPTSGDDEDEDAEMFMRNVTGTLKIIRDGNYPEYIRLQNDKPIRPAFGVKIREFLTLLKFGPATEDGPIVPLSVDVKVQGRAMLAIKFDESEVYEFSDYEFVGESPTRL